MSFPVDSRADTGVAKPLADEAYLRRERSRLSFPVDTGAVRSLLGEALPMREEEIVHTTAGIVAVEGRRSLPPQLCRQLCSLSIHS